MRNLLLSFLFLLPLGFISCSKDEEPVIIPDPVFAETPSSAYPGDEVVIKGNDFNNDLSLTYDGNSLQIKSSTTTEIKFIVPETSFEDFEKVKTKRVTIQLKDKGTVSYFDLKILFREPVLKWFNNSLEYLRVGSNNEYIGVTGKQTLWAHGIQQIMRSTDGGSSWNRNAFASTFGEASYFIDDKNIWMDYDASKLAYTTDSNRTFTDVDLSDFIKITPTRIIGLWADKFNSGVVSFENQLIVLDDFKENKVFSLYTTSDKKISIMKAVSKYHFAAFAKGSTNSKMYLIYKPETGMASQYDISAYVSTKIQNAQLLNDGTIYFTSENNIFKISWPFNVEKLPQSASQIKFIDSNTGYAMLKNKMYKTTNGGQNWTEELQVDLEYSIPVSYFEKDGMRWAVFRNEKKKHLFLKYNPE